LAASPILDVPDSELLTQDFGALAAASLARVAAPEVRGFWIQIDADVLNPAVMAAVDSPEPGGPMPNELVSLLAPLVRHPRAMGLSLTSYDPALDPDRSCARRLLSLIETLVTREDQSARDRSGA
jgi:arginase